MQTITQETLRHEAAAVGVDIAAIQEPSPLLVTETRAMAIARLLGFKGEELDAEWVLKSNCRSTDGNVREALFVMGAAQHEVIKQMCRPCPVWRECRVSAMGAECEELTGDKYNVYGIRGGLTDRQRRAALKQIVPQLPVGLRPVSKKET